jgi:putative membrane protein
MLLSLILYWVLTAVVLLIVDALLPGIAISGFGTALIAALVMGLVNFFIRPVLSVLTLPLNLLTLGLFSFVGSLLLSIMTSILGMVLPGRSRLA